MAIWNAWQDLDTLRREVDRAFEGFGFIEPFFRTAFLPGRGARQYPLINVQEDKDTIYVEALAPGVDPASLELSVVHNVLTISGEKHRLPEDIKAEAYQRSERTTGRFVRSIEVPVEVEEDKVQADYQDGLLTVSLPKAERAKPRQIKVQVG